MKKKIPKYVTNKAFIILKDHKQNFPHTIKCRTINPAKSHVGKWCKIILQKHLDRIRSKSGLTQWKNSMEVTKWFEKLNDKRNKCFINFDIVELYSSITKPYLIDAIKFSKKFTKFSDDDTELILHACQSVLFHENETWCKKNSNSYFDIVMGSFHRAEICDLNGLSFLDKVNTVTGISNIGFYRDDGHGVIDQTNGTHRVRLKKKMLKVFNDIGFKITIEIGSTSTDFIDVSLILLTDYYQVYSKPNTKIIHVNKNSNHLPTVRKQLPKMIENRLVSTSKNENAFNITISMFQTAINKVNYNYKLKFNRISKNRKRKCIY